MPPRHPLKVFVLGSFRDLEPSGTHSMGVLQRLVMALRNMGWDAFLSGDPRSLELAGASFPPRTMTEVLEGLCDLAFYVGVKGGRGDGWVSELTAMQLRFPAASKKRVLLLEAGYPLTSILDPTQGGYLTEEAIIIGTWTDENQLYALANNCAFHLATQGRLPPVI